MNIIGGPKARRQYVAAPRYMYMRHVLGARRAANMHICARYCYIMMRAHIYIYIYIYIHIIYIYRQGRINGKEESERQRKEITYKPEQLMTIKELNGPSGSLLVINFVCLYVRS